MAHIPIIPDHILKNFGTPTRREWKQRKRQELKQLRKALNVFRQGSAWVPHIGLGTATGGIDVIVTQLEEIMSQRIWGR